MKIRTICLLLPAVLCLLVGLTIAQSAAEKNRKAGLVRAKLAGAELDPTLPNFVKFDVKQGYYLVRFTDGLGSPQVTFLYLFPDPKKNGGYRLGSYESTKPQHVSLPSIRSGWGVNIGATPKEVQRKLGRSPDFSSYDKQRAVSTYLYKAPIHLELYGSRNKWEYTAKYIFDKGRLRVIEYEARDPLPKS